MKTVGNFRYCASILTRAFRVGDHTSIPEGGIMVVLIVITAAAQIFFKHAFKRTYSLISTAYVAHVRKAVIDHLPMSLSTKKLAARFARERQGAKANGDGDGKGDHDGLDLFSRRREL